MHNTSFPAAHYAARRALLARQLKPSSVAIVPTAPERPRNRDNAHPYRADSYFFYLTGFTEPNACLLIESSGYTTLLCQPKDESREIWEGVRLGPERAPAVLGVDAAYASAPPDAGEAQISALLENKSCVYFPFGIHEGLPAKVEGWLSAVRAKARAGVVTPLEWHDLCGLLDEMRLFKDEREIATLRKAGWISARAHVRAMQTCASRIQQGLPTQEFHLEAELLHAFRSEGAQGVAYNSIVASGAKACILHYRAGDGLIRDGELVLIDAGCELDGYASDITRTFPANGRFSGPQRDLYDCVLQAQAAAIAACRPGHRFDQVHEAATEVLARGLLELGLLDARKVGSLEAVLAQKAYLPFYMHRTSHWLGLDVHDCGRYTEDNEGSGDTEDIGVTAADHLGPPASRLLRAGMVLTIEPGLYVRPAEHVPECFWNIAIRIEDDALVTDGGCSLFTRDVPVEVAHIEALMQEAQP